MKKLTILISSLFLASITLAKEPQKAQVSGESFLGVRGNSAQITLGKQSCSLKSLGELLAEKNKKSFRLEFNCGGVIQILFDTEKQIEGGGKYAVDEPLFALLWAGDKDHDGRIDLIMEMSPKYSYSEKVTFLSSKAKKHDLLGVADIKRESFD